MLTRPAEKKLNLACMLVTHIVRTLSYTSKGIFYVLSILYLFKPYGL